MKTTERIDAVCQRPRFAAAALAVLSLLLASAAGATDLAPKGRKALLEYSIEIEGKASASNKNGEYQHWSTRRSLAVQTTLIAQQPSVQDPGDPGGPHAAAGRPKDQPFQPSADMEAFTAEIEKCGEDIACRMRLTQKMMQNPQIQADVQKAQKAAESLRGAPRYQIWLVDRKTPATGTLKMEVQEDELFKTAVDERRTCRQAAEMTLEQLSHGVSWPAMIKIDAQAGTYAANIGGVSLHFVAKKDCINLDGKERSQEHTEPGTSFLPGKYQKGAPDEVEVFRGGADAATGGRRLAHGEKVLTGLYGSVMGGVPMTAKVTVRWTVTVKD